MICFLGVLQIIKRGGVFISMALGEEAQAATAKVDSFATSF